jgi:hypothetical protein
MPSGSIETPSGQVRVRHRSAALVRLAQIGRWLVFLAATALLLRPVLLTAVVADDLINPFSQAYHAGTSIGSILDRTWHFVSITGHFNYVGQTIGSLTVLFWTYLISDLGIRYSSVYAITKFLIYLLCIIVGSRLLRETTKYAGIEIGKWHSRIWVLVGLAGTIQLHVPWSNDPVASYPLAGYLTTSIGLGFLFLAFVGITRSSYGWASLSGVFGSLAVLYYEFNSFAILASAPVIGVIVWRSRNSKSSILRNFLISFISVGPAAVTTVFFYLRNRAASANYTGTAVSFGGRFPTAFRNGLISALPGSSWPIARDWLGHDIQFVYPSVRNFLLGILCIAALLAFVRREIRIKRTRRNTDKVFLLAVVAGLLIYWFGATLAQTSTIKIQDESRRVGQVYNYYAVAGTCFVLVCVALLILVPWERLARPLIAIIVAIAIGFSGYQYTVNWNVLAQFNAIMKPSRDLLAAYADRPSMAKRCAAFNQWKAMGWPEYYWLDMQLGLDKLYQRYQGEAFCK